MHRPHSKPSSLFLSQEMMTTFKSSRMLRSLVLPRRQIVTSDKRVYTRNLSSQKEIDDSDDESVYSHQRVWFAPPGDGDINKTNPRLRDEPYWTESVSKEKDLPKLLKRIGKQELEGGRMRLGQLGVLRQDPAADMRMLTQNYTVPALASAVRDREEVLQLCAELAKAKKWDELTEILQPYQHDHIRRRRREDDTWFFLDQPLNVQSLEVLRKGLMRMPRRVSQAHKRRAGVVVCLCNVDGVPSILLEKRASSLRAHPDEVCLPGGMVSNAEDRTIAATCLREMHEEIAGLPQPVSVLGVLRCNWGEVQHLVGVAVTPLVAFVGEIGDKTLKPNPDEVAEVFSVPLEKLLDREQWIHKEGFAPIFLGGPHVIWGLTGYIVERFVLDILARYASGGAPDPRVAP